MAAFISHILFVVRDSPMEEEVIFLSSFASLLTGKGRLGLDSFASGDVESFWVLEPRTEATKSLRLGSPEAVPKMRICKHSGR